MARVVALVPDLMFGSKVIEMLSAAGHEVVLCSSEPEVWREAEEDLRTDVLLVDLTSDEVDGVTLVDSLRSNGDLHGTRTLAVYSHVDIETKARAEEVGFDQIVPRSRMAREGADLVTALTGAG